MTDLQVDVNNSWSEAFLPMIQEEQGLFNLKRDQDEEKKAEEDNGVFDDGLEFAHFSLQNLVTRMSLT